MSKQPLNLADGQLGSSAATLLTAAGARAAQSGRVDVVLSNTGSGQEVIVLTLTRTGGSARRIARVVLEENEWAIVYGIPLRSSDTLSASTTSDSVVDYTVMANVAGGYRVEVLDAAGTPKGVATLRRILSGAEAAAGDELPDFGV